jgi:branched-chain amino acid transport system permease protein
MMLAALMMLGSLYGVLRFTRVGLVIQASLEHPEMVESLGHNVPSVFMLVFGAGSALAALAGAIGGAAFVTEPVMAGAMGSIVFVVVIVGGLGSLSGALAASLLIGVVQTYAVSIDYSLSTLFKSMGHAPSATSWATEVLSLTVADVAPLLPYVLLILILVLRPRGLLGTRET